MSIIRIARLCIIGVPLIFFLYCGWVYFALSGQWSVATRFAADTPFISQLYPAGRALSPEKNTNSHKWSQTVVGEPVYINVRPSQAFQRALLTIDMQPSVQRFVQVGVVTSTQPFSAQLQLLYSALLEEVQAASWRRIQEDDSVIYTTQSDILSIRDLQKDSRTRIATAGVDIDVLKQEVPLCATQTQPFTLPSQLIGDHDIAFATQSDVDSVVTFQSSESTIEFILLDAKKEIEISRGTYANGQYTLIVPASVEPMMYFVRISHAGGLSIDHLTFPHSCIASQRFVFGDVDAPFIIASTNKRFTFTAIRSDALKSTVTGSFGELNMRSLNAPYVRYSALPASVEISQSGISIASNGYLSFSADTAFDPRGFVLPLDETTTIDDIDALVVNRSTTYTTAHNKSHRRFYSTIDIASVSNPRALQFMISAPGILTQEGELQFFHTQVDLYTDPIWIKIRRAFFRFFSL